MAISDAQYAAWLAKPDQIRALLVEADCYSGGAVVTRYMSNKAFISTPTDTPANIPYDNIVTAVPNIQRRMSEAFSGQSTITWGDIEVDNSSGARDSWLADAWDGRAVRLCLGSPDWPKSDFRLICSGTLGDIAAPANNKLALRLRDKQQLLNVPVQTNLIGGTDANKNQPIPLCYGPCFNVEPVLIDSATSTYQVNDGAINAITDVRDNGVSLQVSGLTVSAVDATNDLITFSANHGLYSASRVVFSGSVPTPLVAGTTYWVASAGLTSSACKLSATKGGSVIDITSTTTGATATGKNWNDDLANGKFSLVASPVGRITADVQGAKPSGTYLTTIADIVSHLVTTHTTLTSADIDTANFAAFNAACPQAVCLYVRERTNLIPILDRLLGSVLGWYGFSRAGLLQLGQLTAPSGAAAISLVADDLKRLGLRVLSRTLPQSSVRLGYQPNWTPQADGLASGVTQANRALYAAEYQVASAADASIKTVHPLATDPDVVPTLLVSAADAAAEAARRLALFGTVRTIYQTPAFTAPMQIELGQVVSLDHPRFGFAGGVLARVVSIDESPTLGRVTLGLWL